MDEGQHSEFSLYGVILVVQVDLWTNAAIYIVEPC